MFLRFPERGSCLLIYFTEEILESGGSVHDLRAAKKTAHRERAYVPDTPFSLKLHVVP
jgi:hypothetical protein